MSKDIYTTTLIHEIALVLNAYNTCKQNQNTTWEAKHEDTLRHFQKHWLPRGCGIICTEIDLDASKDDKIVFYLSYHHMASNGMYDEYTDHTVIVKPSLINGIDLRITGRDKHDIKEFLYQIYEETLTTEREHLDWYIRLDKKENIKVS